MENTVTISMERYSELIRKEVVFDIQAEKLKLSDSSVWREERLLFGVKEDGVEGEEND